MKRKTSAVAAVRTCQTTSAVQKDAPPQLTGVQRPLQARLGQRDITITSIGHCGVFYGLKWRI